MWFINAFAANDLESTRAVWEEASSILPGDAPLAFVYNNRADREYRLPEFSNLPASLAAGRESLVFVIGENAAKAARRFAKAGVAAESLAPSRWEPAELLRCVSGRFPGSCIVFGAGNIKGPGLDLARFFEERGREIRLGGERGCGAMEEI